MNGMVCQNIRNGPADRPHGASDPAWPVSHMADGEAPWLSAAQHTVIYAASPAPLMHGVVHANDFATQ